MRHAVIVTAIVAGALAIWAGTASRSPSDPRATELANQAPRTAPPPPPEAVLTGSRPPRTSVRPAAETSGPTAPPLRVRGAVRVGGRPADPGEVVVWGRGFQTLRVPLRDGGLYDTADRFAPLVPAPDAPIVTAIVPGRALLSGIFPLADVEALILESGAPETLLSGVVVEKHDGRPVPDLDLHLHASRGEPRYGVDAPDLELTESVPAGRLRAIARTDRDGRFEVRGLASNERCDVLPASGLWFSTSDRAVAGGATDAKVTVVPAFRVSARVVADETGDPIPAFQARLAWGGGNDLGFEGTSGAFTMTLPWWDDGPSFEVIATASAAEREPAKATGWIDRARPTATVELRLRRLLPAAKAGVAFEIRDASGSFSSQPFDLELREPPGGGALRQRMPTERVDATHVRATVPAGRWHLRLRAVDVSKDPPDWKGIVDLVEGHETQVRWVVPR